MSEEILNIVNEKIEAGTECAKVEASSLVMALASVRTPFAGPGSVGIEASGGRLTLRRTDRIVAAEAAVPCEGELRKALLSPQLVELVHRMAGDEMGTISIFIRGKSIVFACDKRFVADSFEKCDLPDFGRLDLDRETTWRVSLGGRYLQRIAQTAALLDDGALDIEVADDDEKAAKITLVCGGQLSKRISARWWLAARL